MLRLEQSLHCMGEILGIGVLGQEEFRGKGCLGLGDVLGG